MQEEIKKLGYFLVGGVVIAGLVGFGYLTLVKHPKDLDALYIEGGETGFANGRNYQVQLYRQSLINKYNNGEDIIINQIIDDKGKIINQGFMPDYKVNEYIKSLKETYVGNVSSTTSAN